jgi:hypothetical protein
MANLKESRSQKNNLKLSNTATKIAEIEEKYSTVPDLESVEEHPCKKI